MRIYNVLAIVIFIFHGYQLYSTEKLKIAEQLPDTAFADHLINRAEQLRNEFKFDSSTVHFEKAAQIYEMLLKSETFQNYWGNYLHCLNEMGYNCRRISQYDKGLKYLEKARKAGQKHLVLDHPEIISNYYNIGFIYYRTQQYKEAIRNFQKALDLGIPSLGESSMLVNTNNICLGHVYKDMGYYDEALKYYNRFLLLAIPEFGQEHIKIAYTYDGIASVYYYKSDFERAIEYFIKTVNVKKRLFGENHPEVASTYHNLSVVYSEVGDQMESLHYEQEALNILLNTEDLTRVSLGNTYNGLALRYIYLYQYESALGYLNKAEKVYLDLNESKYLTDIYLNYGVMYFYKKEYDRAIDYFKKSEAVFRQVFGNDYWGIADCYNNIGESYLGKGEFSNALDYFNLTLPIYQAHWGDHHVRTGMLYRNFANVHYQAGRLDSALTWIQKSLGSLVPDFKEKRGTGNPQVTGSLSNRELLNTLELKINICTALSKTKSNSFESLQLVYETCQVTIAWIEKIRIEYPMEESRLLLSDRTHSFYENAIQAAMEIYRQTNNVKDCENIYELIEKSKFAVLTSILHETKIKQYAGIPDSLLRFEKSLRIEMSYHNTEIQKELAKKSEADSAKLRMHQNRYFSYATQYRELIKLYEFEYPQYHRLKYQNRIVTLKGIQQFLDPGSALLEYYIGDKTACLFLIDHENVRFIPLTADSTFQYELNRTIQSIKKIDAPSYLELSSRQAHTLLPDRSLLGPTIDKLIIIPHGMLYKLPFEALITDRPHESESMDFSSFHYLIRDYEISYHYSSTLLMNSKRRKKEPLQDPEKLAFAGFAPVFEESHCNSNILSSHSRMVDSAYTDIDTRSISVNGLTFNDLPYSKNEVLNIALKFKSNNQRATTYLYEQSSEEQFKQVASDYHILHIATHSLINEKNPYLSGIIFSQPEDLVYQEDGVLYTAEIYQMDFNADLIVLSSCESGTGQLKPGEGLMALSRGFLYAGINNLIVSLWKADDYLTSQLMSDFYSHYLNHKTYAASLRKAKLNLIRNPETAFPILWSGFVLIGE